MRHSVSILAALVVATTTTVAGAQLAATDHYKCYKITDPLKVAGVVDLETPQFGLEAGCKLGKAMELCVPAEKRVISAVSKATKAPIIPLDVAGPPSPGDQLCYQVVCPKPVPPDQDVTDQFGTRTLRKLKASRVCTPAYKGAPVVFNGRNHHPYGYVTAFLDGPSGHLKIRSSQPEIVDNHRGILVAFPPSGGGTPPTLKYFWSQVVYGDDPFTPEVTRTGTAVRWLMTSSLAGEVVTLADSSTTDAGATFALTARAPINLNTASTPVLRAAELFCGTTSLGTFAEAVADDPAFEFHSAVPPDRYSGEIVPGAATTAITVTFGFTSGCTPIDPPGAVGALTADRLEIRTTADQVYPELATAVITTNGAGVEIADEGTL